MDKLFIPAGSQITDVKEICGLKIIGYKGQLFMPPPFRWLPIISMALSLLSMGLSIYNLFHPVIR